MQLPAPLCTLPDVMRHMTKARHTSGMSSVLVACSIMIAFKPEGSLLQLGGALQSLEVLMDNVTAATFRSCALRHLSASDGAVSSKQSAASKSPLTNIGLCARKHCDV